VTTALLWWGGVLALTGALVLAVRAWPWSPAQADPSELRTRKLAGRLALLPVAVLLALVTFWSIVMLGWASEPTGWGRVRGAWPLLAVGAVSGPGVVACLLTMAGRRVRSGWLVVGVLPAVGGVASLLGW
jgi:hypothetical protein